MSDAPEQIIAWAHGHWERDADCMSKDGATQYIRKNLHEAEITRLRAQVAAAYEDAARIAWAEAKRRGEEADATKPSTQKARFIAGKVQSDLLARRIGERTPADATAALDALLHQARAEGAEAMREAAANECAIIVKASSLEVGNPEFRAGKVNAARKLHDRVRAIDPEQVVKA